MDIQQRLFNQLQLFIRIILISVEYALICMQVKGARTTLSTGHIL